MKTHKDLEVYNQSIEMVTNIYKLTSNFPKEELFGLTSQMRRAAVSIASNIAEGSARNHQKEFVQFLYLSLGSASELDTQLLISHKLNYINESAFTEQVRDLTKISKMLQGLIKFQKTNL